MTTRNFSFAAHARVFDEHIASSIPSYGALAQLCIDVSRRFIQPRTKVIDIGCSTGHLIQRIHEISSTDRPGVIFHGLDVEPRFASHWRGREQKDLHFQLGDILTSDALRDISLAISLFTIQFVRPQDKSRALEMIYAGLVEGGALLIAEKTYATTSRLQDALTFPYYDHKLRQKFSARQILDKERSLRGQMTLWTADELTGHLRDVGFDEIQPVWGYFPFQAFLAIKRTVADSPFLRWKGSCSRALFSGQLPTQTTQRSASYGPEHRPFHPDEHAARQSDPQPVASWRPNGRP